jgi:hypothetical protein
MGRNSLSLFSSPVPESPTSVRSCSKIGTKKIHLFMHMWMAAATPAQVQDSPAGASS